MKNSYRLFYFCNHSLQIGNSNNTHSQRSACTYRFLIHVMLWFYDIMNQINHKKRSAVKGRVLKAEMIVLLIVSFFINPCIAQINTVEGKVISARTMDQFLKTEMDSLGLPGLSIAVINNAKIIYHRNFGVTNVKTKDKVSKETLFDAGSMSKTPFTYLVMKMVDQGLLNLDQPLYKYLPNPDIAYDERYKLITARMVLSHTSGFPNWRFLNKDQKLDIKFTPGTQFLYSGEGFEYLANVIAHLKNISKNDLQDLFKKEVAIPSGMQNAYFNWNEYVAKHQATGHFDGNISSGWGLNANRPDFAASYSLQTEAISYAKFICAMIQGKGLKEETYNEMLKPHSTDTSRNDGISYCLGIMTKHTAFGNEYLHDGYNRNFYAAFMFNKEQKIGYVFFTNCNNGELLNKRLEYFFTKGSLSDK
jgi:CubicO group peptidase (beta-lactamase class C family)